MSLCSEYLKIDQTGSRNFRHKNSYDDPIIPVEDFYDLKLNPLADLIVHRYGGHNGFLESLSGRAWYEKKIIDDWINTAE